MENLTKEAKVCLSY